MKIYLNYSTLSPWKQLVNFIFISCFGFILLVLMQGIVFVFLSKEDTAFLLSNTQVLKSILFLSQICLFLLPALFFGYYFSDKPLLYNLAIKKTHSQNYLITIVLLIISLPVIVWLGNINQNFHFPPEFKQFQDLMEQQEIEQQKLLRRLFTFTNFYDFFITFLLIALVPALCEELFFRSILNKIFFRIFKKMWVSIILTGILFSIVHFHFIGFLPRLFLGIILSFLLFYCNSIIPSMILHFVFNGMQIVFVYIGGKSSLEKFLSNKEVEIPFLLGGGFFLITLIVLYYLDYQKKKTGYDLSE